MVLYVLYVKANLENIETLTAPPLHRWCLDVKEPRGDEKREGVFVSDEEAVEVAGGRSEAHFTLKWPGANKPSQLTVVRDVKKLTRDVTGADSDNFVPFVGFECRGLEPYAWHPESGYRVVSAGSHATFEDVDLSDDWVEYDSEGAQVVGIYNLEWQLKVQK
ncbi:Uncharacterized conserved protein [Plasmopara halstedii]|uniref:Uncharacterized conserved protein n=1 Tax=Plasmopara halstedii TaxID=4781 RepID=A0A0N7L7P4_PLAHL|nr:Uncharacterized conserved protein [Plasmopara halstedii]CEG47643.1 Uncharacterized conserved protein [Plasmopara halstedii]|eukprot:XP_024584012.1 Uncharacterized conserved protein [Plasmopara halstedii]